MDSQTRAGGRTQLLPGIIIILLGIGVVVCLQVPEVRGEVGGVGLLIGLATAAYLMISRSRDLAPKERTAWRWIALTFCLMWVGVLTLGLMTTVLGMSLPSFGPMDVFFLGAYVAILVGLYRLTRLDSGEQRWVLTFVDALVGSVALAALVWNFIFRDLMEAMAGAPWWEVAIATTYPVADVLIVIALLILVIRRSNYHLDLRLVFLALGAGTQVLADFLVLKRGIGQSFDTIDPAHAVSLVATIFLILTASIVDHVPRKREFPEAPTPIWALMWPYLLYAALIGVHFQTYQRLNPGSDETLLLNAVIFIGGVILLRQVYVILRDRDKVDRKRSELVASVSHELRTPLTAMVGFLTLLDDHGEEFPAEAREEMISEATDQARHMSRLVSDLLMLAKGDMSQMNLEVAEVRAMGIVTAVLRNADVADTKIDQELDADVRVRVDPDRVQQALSNLVSNAVRYGGGHCLIVAVIRGRSLVFEVHDDGEGVPTRFESMIWDHFERGAHRLDATTPGLGIGLSIVHAVAASHGGKAEYRTSERLGGACFRLTIPDCVVAEESKPAKVPAGT